jgi:hypothetical protein
MQAQVQNVTPNTEIVVDTPSTRLVEESHCSDFQRSFCTSPVLAPIVAAHCPVFCRRFNASNTAANETLSEVGSEGTGKADSKYEWWDKVNQRYNVPQRPQVNVVKSQLHVFWLAPNRYVVLDEGFWVGPEHTRQVKSNICRRKGKLYGSFRDKLVAYRSSAEENKNLLKFKTFLAVCEIVQGKQEGRVGYAQTKSVRERHRPPLATVCHPLLRDSSIVVARYWAKYYLDRGFETVIMYAKTKEDAFAIRGVVWYIAKFLGQDHVATSYYYGQHWAMLHCLYTNK